eukprot:TRINITY_DN2040_c0_g2_i1.p1 TRINITY_DN2040_c0_g2~~TRINITY_DN2040_c0_g2_i1.p1  ORF type:complete len:249 (-),score=42.54 TRINITY_DN2040_c0_g2_i1:64-810(-)
MDQWGQLDPFTWSRNWEEDELDDIVPDKVQDTVISLHHTPHINCQTLIIATFGVASSFTQIYFPHRTVIGTITTPDIKGKASEIFSLGNYPGVIVVSCLYETPAESSYSWTEKLFEYFTPQRIVVLDRLPADSYRTGDFKRPSSPFLRKLQTPTYSPVLASSEIPFLESPNMLQKIIAAVLSHCLRRNIPCVGYVSYEEDRIIHANTLYAFEGALKELGFASELKPSDLLTAYKKAVGSFNYKNDSFI